MTDEKDPRAFIRIDSRFDENDKLEALSDAAFRHVMKLWAFCFRRAQDVTPDQVDTFVDGLVPAPRWAKVPPKVRKELCTAPPGYRHALFSEVPGIGGAIAHDYGSHQLTAAEFAGFRAVQAERGSRGMHVRWHERLGKVNPACAWCVGTDGQEALALDTG